MSRVFVREAENDKAEFPDRLISPHRNFVTEAGLAAIDASLSRFDAAHRATRDKGDRRAAASALREVRYWGAWRASAEVIKTPADKGKASFGMTVTLRRDDGRESRLTHGPGETVEIAGSEAVILEVRLESAQV